MSFKFDDSEEKVAFKPREGKYKFLIKEFDLNWVSREGKVMPKITLILPSASKNGWYVNLFLPPSRFRFAEELLKSMGRDKVLKGGLLISSDLENGSGEAEFYYDMNHENGKYLSVKHFYFPGDTSFENKLKEVVSEEKSFTKNSFHENNFEEDEIPF